MTSDNLKDRMQAVSLRMNNVMDTLLPQPDGAQSIIMEAMRYAMMGGGKRLRPFLLVETARLFDVEDDGVWYAALALECVHTYSLVHDDLPCMDDDDLRRGRATVHKQYDEAIGVLSGDGLLTFAFDLLAQKPVHFDPEVRLKLISDMSKAAGHNGMIGGQLIDMQANATTEAQITNLQSLKTGALIEYAVMAGATLGLADYGQQDALRGYARDMGLAFQIKDDILDHEGDPDVLGKAARKDESLGKTTFVSILGLEGAREKASDLAEQAKANLAMFEDKGEILRQTVDFVIERDR